MGLDFTGYEVDSEIYSAQEARFKKHTSNRSMFKPEEVIWNDRKTR